MSFSKYGVQYAAVMNIEKQRLEEDRLREKQWKRWGPYMSERQWSTVREDYSAQGDSWGSFPHDHARSRAYRWGEDGLLGFSDRQCRLCFSLALWNGNDTILKERLFGLTGPEGNHGEDVKENYYYLDSTPTHSYAKALYKYPHSKYPYRTLVESNRLAGLNKREVELEDLGAFDENRYFDITAEYAKNTPEDICIRLTCANRGPEAATLHILPTLLLRNTWSWGCADAPKRPSMSAQKDGSVEILHEELGDFIFQYEDGGDSDVEVLFTENETDSEWLWGLPNECPYVKNAFHKKVIHGDDAAVNDELKGTKCAPHFMLNLKAGEERVLKMRLSLRSEMPEVAFGENFDQVLTDRIQDSDDFHNELDEIEMTEDAKAVSRQARAGLLWTKQYYYYVVEDWLKGDDPESRPPDARLGGRNRDWKHFHANDILSMPDKWEYPWFAAWDTAFHMIPFAKIDPEFAKSQLELFLREWYMHPNGQLPAYEFNFCDVNPPVHAWAAWRVYKLTGKRGTRDRPFLESMFQKLLINFTWWVNRKDAEGNNLFQGGFLGLDNIGVFDRSKPLPVGGFLQQSDGTAWMAFYCLTMLSMALELAQENPVYEDLASKFFEHYIGIADAMDDELGDGLWDEKDGFYYDQLKLGKKTIPLKTRSLVGLLPLIAVEVLEEKQLEKLPAFTKRMEWFIKHRPELARYISFCDRDPDHKRRLLAVPSKERLEKIFAYLFDESEFLSPHGIRSLSRYHKEKPYIFSHPKGNYMVDYVPGEGNTHDFGGNSNWRGPIWFPTNFLLLEALQRYAHFYGDDFKVEYPTGSGEKYDLNQVAKKVAGRLTSIFLADKDGARPCHGGEEKYSNDPHWKELVLFHEYFHAENGRGCGASHQTGWTAMVLSCLQMASETDD